MMAAAFQQLDRGRPLTAQCLLTQSMKAVHQCVLDDGAWTNAWLLTGIEDPYLRTRWGGSETEMEVVSSYNKVLDELERRTAAHRTTTTKSEVETDDSARNQPSAKEKARRTAQSSGAKAKAAAAAAAAVNR
jgi:hypothetical protein